MADVKTLDEEREQWLDAIDRLDADIDVLERAMKDGSASLDRGLYQLRDLHEMRAEKFRALGSVEARIEFRAREQRNEKQQDQERQDKGDWKRDPETVGAARVPEATRNDELDWLSGTSRNPEADPATDRKEADRAKADELDWLRKDIENRDDAPARERERSR